MRLLDLVHSLVGRRQQFLGIDSILWERGVAGAEREDFFTADAAADGDHHIAEIHRSAFHRFRGDVAQDQDEFIAAHARDKVTGAAMLLQPGCHGTEDPVAFQMAETVIHLLEPIQVQDQNRQPATARLAACQFLVEVEKQGADVGQAGQSIGGCRRRRHLVLMGVFDGQADLGTDGLQNSQMIAVEDIVTAVVEG